MYRFNDMFDNPTPEYLPSKNMEDRLYISSGSGKRWYSPGELENDNGERDIWTTLWHGWMDGWMEWWMNEWAINGQTESLNLYDFIQENWLNGQASWKWREPVKQSWSFLYIQ